MDSYISWFIHGLALIPVTLLPIINPLASAPVFAATVGTNHGMAQRLARQVAINAWFVLVVSMLIGTYVLALFGISLPVVRIGGGLLVATTAWQMLHHTGDDDIQTVVAQEAKTLSEAEIVQRSFFPITFPLTTGPGTIAASIALGAKIPPGPGRIRARRAGGRLRSGAGLAGAVPDFQELGRRARAARQDRYAGDDPDDGVHPAVHRYPDHVDRLGRAERDRVLTPVRAAHCPGNMPVSFKAVPIWADRGSARR